MRWLRTDLSVLFFDNSFWKVSKKSSFRLFLAIALNYLKRSLAFRRTYENRLKNVTRHQINNGILEFHQIPTGKELPLCMRRTRELAVPTGGVVRLLLDRWRLLRRHHSRHDVTSAHYHNCHSLTSLSLTHLLSITTKTAESRSVWNLNVVYILRRRRCSCWRYPSCTTWNKI